MGLEQAWAAGFFDGEGSTYVVNTSSTCNQIVMKVAQEHKAPLDRFLSAVSVGVVRGPYNKKNPNHSQYYTWTIGSLDGVAKAARVLTPYLCQQKKDQLAKAWNLFYSKPHPGVGAPGCKRTRKKSNV